MQVEAAQLGSQLSQALAECDAGNNSKVSQVHERNKSEEAIVRPRSSNPTLLREITRHDDPTIPSDEDLDLESLSIEATTNTSTLISSHLVPFRNVNELQHQNQRLLKIVRDLGEKMESKGRVYREAMEREQAEAIREAHEAMQELAAQLEAQKQASDNFIKAYVKERDALKTMLSHADAGVGLPSGSMSNGSPGVSDELAQELAEVQSQFNAYKLEMGIDSGRLCEDFIAAQREVNRVSATFAKANAKVEFLSGKDDCIHCFPISLICFDRQAADARGAVLRPLPRNR